MRSYPSFLPLSALLVGTLLWTAPAFAQQPAAATPDTAAPAAPAPALAPVLPPDPAMLMIPAPPGGKLRMEMDARSEDLLGMVKSFLKGVGETNASGTAKTDKLQPNPIADALDAGNLADTLKDVNRVHFVVWELPGPPTPLPSFVPVMPGKPHAKPAKMLPAPPTPPDPVSTFDSNAFYENAFAAEGAHRILYTDADAYKLVMVGFPDRKGYAFAVSGAGYVAVSRSDGYPNLEALSAFISHVTSAAMNSKVLKDAVSGAMGGDKGTDKPDDNSGKGDDKKL